MKQSTKRAGRSISVGIALFIVLALIAAGCGSDSADEPAADEPAADQPAEASGEPIVIMTVGTLGTAEGATTSIEQTAVAYEGWINANGGLGPEGRPLEVIFCNDQDSPEGGRECANEAIAADVTALVGGYSIQGAFEILPLLEENSIPWLGLGLLGGGVEISPMSYPVAGGSLTEWMAIGQEMGARGCGTAGVIRWPFGPGVEAQEYFGHGLASEGGEIGPVAPVGFDATDLLPAVAAASDGVDCMMFGMSPEQGALTVRAAQELGLEIPLGFYPDAVTPQSVEVTGGVDSPAEGGISASWWAAAREPIWDEAKAAVEQYADDPSAVTFTDNFNFQITWVAFKTFESILDTFETVEGLTGADLIAVLDSGQEFETGGFTRPVQWAENIEVKVPEGGENTRFFNPDIVMLTIQEGDYHCMVEGCPFEDMTELSSTFEPAPFEEGEGGPPEGEGGPPEGEDGPPEGE